MEMPKQVRQDVGLFILFRSNKKERRRTILRLYNNEMVLYEFRRSVQHQRKID